jgi:hypothetical protein
MALYGNYVPKTRGDFLVEEFFNKISQNWTDDMSQSMCPLVLRAALAY